MNHLARESLVSRWAATLLHLQGLCQAAVVGHGDFHVDFGDAGGPHLGGVRRSDENVIQIRQNHHQVLTGCRHAIGTTPVFLLKERKISSCSSYHRKKRLSSGAFLQTHVHLVTALLRATHLSEDNLKPLSLSAALLPPLPGQTSYQGDVVALQGTTQAGKCDTFTNSNRAREKKQRERETHNNLHVSIIQQCSSRTGHVGDGVFELTAVRTHLQQC